MYINKEQRWGGGLIAYGFHFHLHCLNPGRMGVGRFPLPFALSKSWKDGGGVGWGVDRFEVGIDVSCQLAKTHSKS